MSIPVQGETGGQAAFRALLDVTAELYDEEQSVRIFPYPAPSQQPIRPILEAIPAVLPGSGSFVAPFDFDSQQPLPVYTPSIPVFPTAAQIQALPSPAETSIPAFMAPSPPSSGVQLLGTNPQLPTLGSVGLEEASPSSRPIKTINARGYSIYQLESYGYKRSQSGTLPQPFSTRPFFGWTPLVSVALPRGYYHTDPFEVGNFPDGRIAIGPIHYNATINIRTDGTQNQVKERLFAITGNNPSINQPSTIENQVVLNTFPAQSGIEAPVRPVNGPYIYNSTSPLNEQTPELITVNPGVGVTPSVDVLGRADKSRFQIGVQMDTKPYMPLTGRMKLGQPTVGYPYKIHGILGNVTAYATTTAPHVYGTFGQDIIAPAGTQHINAGARLDSQKYRGFIQGSIITAPAVLQYDTNSFEPGYGNSP